VPVNEIMKRMKVKKKWFKKEEEKKLKKLFELNRVNESLRRL